MLHTDGRGGEKIPPSGTGSHSLSHGGRLSPSGEGHRRRNGVWGGPKHLQNEQWDDEAEHVHGLAGCQQP